MSKYTDRITNYHRGKPLFIQHIDLSTQPLTDASLTLESLLTAFDIDSAVGVQLDVLGEPESSASQSVEFIFPLIPMGSDGIRAFGRVLMTLTQGLPA